MREWEGGGEEWQGTVNSLCLSVRLLREGLGLSLSAPFHPHDMQNAYLLQKKMRPEVIHLVPASD